MGACGVIRTPLPPLSPPPFLFESCAAILIFVAHDILPLPPFPCVRLSAPYSPLCSSSLAFALIFFSSLPVSLLRLSPSLSVSLRLSPPLPFLLYSVWTALPHAKALRELHLNGLNYLGDAGCASLLKALSRPMSRDNCTVVTSRPVAAAALTWADSIYFDEEAGDVEGDGAAAAAAATAKADQRVMSSATKGYQGPRCNGHPGNRILRLLALPWRDVTPWLLAGVAEAGPFPSNSMAPYLFEEYLTAKSVVYYDSMPFRSRYAFGGGGVGSRGGGDLGGCGCC